MKLYYLMGWLLCFRLTAVADSQKFKCPDWIRSDQKNLPVCSPGKLIPETFPAAAIVISDETPLGKDSAMATELSEKIIKAYANSDQFPALVVSGRDETLSQIRAQVEANPTLTEAQKKRIQSSIVQIKGVAYTWQQDYFKAFINPATGLPVLRDIGGYEKFYSENQSSWIPFMSGPKGYGVDSLQSVLKNCGFEKGEPLKQPVKPKYSPNRGHTSGTDGGNILSLPGGLCGIGLDKFSSSKEAIRFAEQFCDPKDVVVLPTSLFEVGHTDELIKVIKNHKQAAPCDLSLMIGSPRVAEELLRSQPNDLFLSPPSPSSKGKEAEFYSKSEGLSDFCGEIKRNRSPQKQKKYWEERGVGTQSLLREIIGEKAHAESLGTLFWNQWNRDCLKMTNLEVAEVLKNPRSEIGAYNRQIQIELNTFKEELKKKILAKFAKNGSFRCELDFLEVPQIFTGGFVINEKPPRLQRGLGKSLVPSPVNSLIVNRTMITSDPMNQSFKKYISESFQARGYESDFFDTFEKMHLNSGNVHCMTQAIPVCRPR